MDILEVLRDMGIGAGKKLKGDALPGHLRLGKTAMNADGEITGTLAVRATGATSITPGTTAQILTAGIYDADITVAGDADMITANIKAGININGVAGKAEVVDTTEALLPAAAADMIAGKVAFVNGVKRTGVIVNNPADTKGTVGALMLNIVKNGSFENGLTDWGANLAATIVATTFKYGTKSVEVITAGTRGYCGVASSGVEFVPKANSKYYMCGNFYVKSFAAGGPVMLVRASTENIQIKVAIDVTKLNQWQFKSLSFNTAGYTLSTCDYFAIHDDGGIFPASTFDVIADGITVINLTEAFGVGLEPTQAQMDAIMTALDGYFVGTTILTKLVNGAYITNGATGVPEVMLNEPNFVAENMLAGKNYLGLPGGLADLGGAQTASSTWADNLGTLVFRIPTKGAFTAVVGTNPEVIATDPDFIPANILSGKNIFNVVGSIPNYANTAREAASIGQYGNGNIAVYMPSPAGYYTPGTAGSGGAELILTVAQTGLVASKILVGQTIAGIAGTAPPGKKFANGSGTIASAKATVTGLSFVPAMVLVRQNSPLYWYVANAPLLGGLDWIIANGSQYTATWTSSGFALGVYNSSSSFEWWAWEQ